MTDALDETVDGGPHPGRRALVAGAQLGKYTLERVLGAGGMGIVWAARDPDLERSVAIKLLLSADAGPEQRARFLREARAMARLKHPNVLTVYEVDTDADRDFIAMELVDGTTMDAWLDCGPPASEVWAAIIAAGRGLAAAHAAGLVHRDFKPHNVLRSRDARVLVTDFGLARGLGADDGDHTHVEVPAALPVALDATVEATPGAPIAKPSSQSGSRSDKILDSTLTQPGALIGTPAYMAPEQFTGAAPDPRTDQFAFSVTAWQALTGKRPFAGESIDELRKSAAKGVAHVAAKMPRAVRAVLARGLAAEPDARWPDLDALLDALERARVRPRRRRAIGFAVFGLGAAGVLFATMRHRDAAPAATSSCDATFDAWTPAHRAAFEKRFDRHPNAIAIADAYDAFRNAWLARYHDACLAGRAGSGANAKHAARINCLLGERDDFDGLALLTDTVPTAAIAGFDLWGFLPALEACDGDSPVAPPLLPEDRKQRDQIIALRAQIAAQRATPYVLLEREAALTAAAKKLGWKPLLPELAVAIGAASQWTGDLDRARAHFEVAAEAAERLAYFKLEAAARIGQLEVELDDTTEPSDAHAQKLFEAAADAVQRAGNDVSLATSIDTLRARYAQSRGDLATAIDRFEHARATLLAARGYRVAEVAASAELDALAERDALGDLDTAWRVGQDTLHALEAAHRATMRLTATMSQLAWSRGDLDEAHALADRYDERRADPSGTPIHGTVVGPDGAPVAGATVVSWSGRLWADATRIYVYWPVEGGVVTTDAHGAFTINRYDALVAEHGELRSRVAWLKAAGDPLTVKLGPTRTVTGSVDGTLPADARVSARIGTATDLGVSALVRTDHTYEIRGVPADAATLEVAGRVFREDFVRVRSSAQLAWPSGATLDVVVRGIDAHAVDVLRGPKLPKDRAELDARVNANGDVAVAELAHVGLANMTDAGSRQYAHGDVHAVIRDSAPGDVTLCAVAKAGPPTCKTATLVAGVNVVVLGK